MADRFFGLRSLVHIVLIQLGLAVGFADEPFALETPNQARGLGEPAICVRTCERLVFLLPRHHTESLG